MRTRRRLKQLRLKTPVNVQDLQQVQLMQQALNERGYAAAPGDICAAWMQCSISMAASWLRFDPVTGVDLLLEYLEPVEPA